MRTATCLCFWSLVACAVAPVPRVLSQEEKQEEKKEEKKEEPQKRPSNLPLESYLTLRSVKYLPPPQAGGQQALEFRFDLAPDVPRGVKMDFILEHQAEEVASAVYTLKDEIRTNLTFTLKPNDKLTVDEYFLRTRMALGEQTAEVKKLFAAKAKRFPPDADPWTWFYVEKPIAVGTEEEGIAENAARCEAFRGFLDRLATNLGELTESLEKVKKGEDCVQNGKLDVEKFTKLVVDWRKKQGEIQKEIGGFPDKEPALWRKAKAAHYQLVQAGQMVSKRSIQLQKEVTDKYSVPVINPDSHPAFSQGSVRGSPTPARLNLSVKEILEKVCPPEEEEAAEPEEAGKAEKAEKSGKSEKSGK